MSEIVTWIEEAAVELGRSFVRCPKNVAQDVVQEARARFVAGDPRVWWLGLARPCTAYDSQNRSFLDVVPEPTQRVWFIPEDESDALPVYDLLPEDVELIRQNCPLFEYYVTDKCFLWLIVESDHDQFIVCKSSETST